MAMEKSADLTANLFKVIPGNDTFRWLDEQ